VQTAYTSNNPAGIDINLGYYALAECLIKGTDASKALLRWCGVWFDKTKPRKTYTKRPMGKKTRKILAVYDKHPQYPSVRIAELAKCTPEMVAKVFRKVGIRRNRWNGYKEAIVIEIYEKNPMLQTKKIAEQAGCTPEAVRRILRKIGVKKKNKWDGYISQDPRYSKDKRGK
jgi:predicted HTH domain antitoxin